MKFDLEVFRSALQTAPLAVFLAETHTYRKIPASLDPIIIPDPTWKTVAQACQHALKGLQALARQLSQAQDSARSEALYAELSPLEKLAARINADSSLATARFDLFFDGQNLQIIEANTTIPAMQAYSDMIRGAWLKAVGVQETSSPNSEDLLASLLSLYQKDAGNTAKPKIAIVAREGDSQLAELNYLRQCWTQKGYPTTILQPTELRIAGSQLKSGEMSFDLIYRHIFASRLDPASDFAKACLEHAIFHIYNPIAAHLEIKALFAELSRYAADAALAKTIGLTAEEQAILQKHLPWTRIIPKQSEPPSQALQEILALVREDYVIKSSSGYGGHAVFIGSHFYESETQQRLQSLLNKTGTIHWQEFIQNCAEDEETVWVIQRRMEGRRMKHRFLYDTVEEQESFVDCSIFAWAHAAPRGGASRFSKEPIVNIGRGGGLLPLFLQSEYEALTKTLQNQ